MNALARITKAVLLRRGDKQLHNFPLIQKSPALHISSLYNVLTPYYAI